MNSSLLSSPWWKVSGAVAAFALAVPASAAVLATDSFEVGPALDDVNGIYALGATIEGTSPDTFGFGPTNAWTNSSGANFPTVAGGLTFAGYGGTGGAVEATNTASNFQQTGRVVTADASPVTSQLFVSVLLNREAASINEVLTSAFLGRVGSTGGGPLEFGIIGDDFGVNFNTDSGNSFVRTAGSEYTPGETVLLVLQVDINDAEGDDDTWYLYANPDTSSAPAVGDALLTGTGQLWDGDTTFGPAALRFVEPAGNVTDVTTTFTADELRIGTTFESVIPEPGSIGLLGLASTLIFARRRKA
ncbi:MAG: PEP-CTERM sorting domain-containing protein [Planctomycetota bacterium]